MNTATCNFHGTASPADANYTKFATSLTGPRGRKGLSLQSQVEQHHAGAVSVAIIENGVVTQHHWYGCRDRASAQRSATTTMYSTASLSKFVSAIALVKAARAGIVNLDRSVQAYADEHRDSLLAEWVDDKFDGDFTKDYPKSITLRRLLSHTAGLDTHGIGAWEPGNVPSMRDILMGTDGHSNSFLGGVEPIAAPSVAKVVYSGGGYIVAEHILELESPLSFENYVKDNVLDVAGHKLSTYDLAQPSMGNLARPCSRGSCGDYILQTRVKAAGGLLANVREYATLVATLATGGKTPTGREVMQQADINTLLTPASASASLEACTVPGKTREVTSEFDSGNPKVDLPPVTVTVIETCVAGRYRRPLAYEGQWYGLGVELSTAVEPDGYPRVVEHGGDQPGAHAYFKIDRRTGNGFVVMASGNSEWVDGDGFTYGSNPLVDAIKAAYAATY